MYDKHPWRAEIAGSIVALLVALFLGWLFQSVVPALLALALLLLCRHLYELMRLERWLRTGGDVPGAAGGIWGRVFDQLYRVKQQNREYKKRRTKVINRFRKATGALPDATVVLDEHNNIDWFNKPAGRLLGLEKRDRGQRIGNLLRHPEFVNYLHEGDDHDTISIPAPADPSIILEIRIVSYGGGLRLLIARDVTRIRQMERIRSDFVANASHELRTPITVLKGYLETVRDHPQLPPMLIGALERMKDQSERMQHLVDDLLLLTTLESTPPQQGSQQPVGLSTVLDSICRDSEQIDRDRRIELSIESEADLIGNAHELRSAFANLIVNALKYSPPDSAVMVRWYQSDDGAHLDVIDQGEGIDSKHLPKLTERFFRVDVARSRRQGGTGLGLAIVKHVLSRHDAVLHIDSAPGEGSCFSARFPQHRLWFAQPADQPVNRAVSR